MSINHAILGLLSARPMTGYDLKKVMQASPFLYWSGNNNQIYKALLALHEHGYVTGEVQHADNAPSKKRYTITGDGLFELRRWLGESPEAPEYKNPFLVRLAWADMLGAEEITALLDQYEQAVQGQLAMAQAAAGRGYFAPNRTARETALWSLIYDNIAQGYAGELQWIEQARQTLAAFPGGGGPGGTADSEQEDRMMTHELIEKNGKKYVLLRAPGQPLASEQDALDAIALCGQNDATRLLIEDGRIPDAFLQLRSGVLGAVLQKFSNYRIRAAAVLDATRMQGRFLEFANETNRGNAFRVFATFDEAEQWLLS